MKETGGQFEEVLRYLRQSGGVEFRAYKGTSVQRRILKRMQVLGVPTLDAYFEYLQIHRDELGDLVNTIFINETSFFRDPQVWSYVAAEILPSLVAERKEAVLRVWSAGCAGGQEPYTLAMLLAENLGAETLRERVKIYATDVDEASLAEARAATYPARQVTEVPPALLGKYFERSGSRYTVKRQLRRSIVFGRHNLVQDAPISRIDLLACRNTLMYFHTDAQARVLDRFHLSVTPAGYLLLGRAELPFRHAAMFQAVDLKRRVFRTVPPTHHRDS